MSSSALPTSSAAMNPMRQQLDELDALLQRMLTLPVNHLVDAGEAPLPDSPLEPATAKSRTRFSSSVEAASPTFGPVAPEGKAPPPALGNEKPAPLTVNEPPAKSRGPARRLSVFPANRGPAALGAAESPPMAEKKPMVVAPTVVLPDQGSVPRSEPGWGPSHVEEPQGVYVHHSPDRLPGRSPDRSPESAHSTEQLVPEKPSPFLVRHEARLREQRRTAPWLGPLGWINVLFDRCAVALGRPGLWLVRTEGRQVLGWIGVGMLVAAAVILAGDWFGWTW